MLVSQSRLPKFRVISFLYTRSEHFWQLPAREGGRSWENQIKIIMPDTSTFGAPPRTGKPTRNCVCLECSCVHEKYTLRRRGTRAKSHSVINFSRFAPFLGVVAEMKKETRGSAERHAPVKPANEKSIHVWQNDDANDATCVFVCYYVGCFHHWNVLGTWVRNLKGSVETRDRQVST